MIVKKHLGQRPDGGVGQHGLVGRTLQLSQAGDGAAISSRLWGVMAAGIVWVHTCHPNARSLEARTTSTASRPFIHPVNPPVWALSRSWQHGNTASRERAAVARSITA